MTCSLLAYNSDGSEEWTPDRMKRLDHQFRDDGVGFPFSCDGVEANSYPEFLDILSRST